MINNESENKPTSGSEAGVNVIVIEIADESEGIQHHHTHPHVVHIYSEVDEKDHAFRVKDQTLVEHVFQSFYAKTGVVPSSHDLFKCEANGKDLSPFGPQSIHHLIAEGHCRQLIWIFSNREVVKKYRYFVDGKPYETTHSALTGAQITAQIPDFNASYQLVLEADPDRVIPPTETVDLNVDPELHFYTVPPATFG